MTRARSLFEIDQEPLFVPCSLEAGDDAGDRGWDESYNGYDVPPPALATATRHADDENSARLGGGRRSRLLVVVAAIGVAAVVGSRLAQVAGSPTVAPLPAVPVPVPRYAPPPPEPQGFTGEFF